MKKIIYSGLVAIIAASAAQAQTTIFDSQSITVGAQFTADDIATGQYDPGVAGELSIRERREISQTNRRGASFIQFDVSTITPTDIATPSFSAAFTIEYNAQLNDLNVTSAVLGRVTEGDGWDLSGTDYPLFTWASSAADSADLIVDIAALAPANQEVTLDVTSIVSSWVDGTNDNFGFVLYIDDLQAQAAGFSNPELLITVPEPSALALLAGMLALTAVACKRRK